MPLRSQLALGLSLVLAAVIAILTLMPLSAPSLLSVDNSDKIYHALAFAGLALPVALFRPDWLIVAVPAYSIFGGMIEMLQPFVGRECSLGDWIADLIGIGVGSAAGIGMAALTSPIQQRRLLPSRLRVRARWPGIIWRRSEHSATSERIKLTLVKWLNA